MLTLCVGRLGWLDPWLVRRGALQSWRGWAVRPRGSGERPSRARRLDLAGRRSCSARSSLLMLLASMLPSIDFDVLEYHLQGPKEYYQAGRITYLPHNVYTNMPFNVEMLHLLAMEVMGDWWWGGLSGQLLVALFGPAAAILIGGSGRAGRVAARGLDCGACVSCRRRGFTGWRRLRTSRVRFVFITRP